MKGRLVTTFVMLLGLVLATGSHASPRVPGGLPAYSGLGWFLISFELGPWEQYLIAELTPDLDRLGIEETPRVTWLNLDDRVILPEFAHALVAPQRSVMTLSFRQSRSLMLLSDEGGKLINDGYRFEQSLIMPGVTQEFGDRSVFSVSAILASQRFGSSGMNLQESSYTGYAGARHQLYEPGQSEVSHGAGVRFALSSDVFEGLRLEAAFQSRIDMGELATLHGVHGANAELDIPPRVQLGLQLSATERSWLSFGISQIFYSEIGAFPSRALPARFTALLGDSTSPQFAWDDLVVYNLGWHWRHASDLELYVDYRTRSQPRPTAPSLASALDSELAQNSFLVGLSKGLTPRTRFQFNAAYAPPEFAFGGNVLGVVSDKLDQSLEVQALVNFDF